MDIDHVKVREMKNSSYTLKERSSPFDNYGHMDTKEVNKFLRYPTFRTKEGRPTFGQTNDTNENTQSGYGLNLMQDTSSIDPYNNYSKRKSRPTTVSIKASVPKIRGLRGNSPNRGRRSSWKSNSSRSSRRTPNRNSSGVDYLN